MEPPEDWELISQMLEEDFSDENKDTDKNVMFTATKLQDELIITPNAKQESANIGDTENSAEKSNYSDDQDSDDIPLADLVRQKRRKTSSCKRSLFKGDIYCSESELDLDDDVTDPTYRITKNDMHSSDSEIIEVQKRKKRKTIKRKKLSEAGRKLHNKRSNLLPFGKNVQPSLLGSKEKIRNKAWKRIPTRLSRTKRITPGRPVSFRHMHQAIEKAKQESSYQHKARQLISDMHKRSIDALLASNGLKRVRIEGDGNCLFKAACVANWDFESPEILRQKLCDHLSSNIDTYIDFLPSGTSANDTERKNKYISKVNFLREEGHWDNDLADALPLAIANLSGRVLKIYCSKRANPMYEIRPILHAKIDENDCINLAFIQVPGFEHYDACTSAITPKDTYQGFTSTEPTNEHLDIVDFSNPTRETITPRKQANYISPVKFTGKRKRKAQPEKWKKNIRKKRRMLGLQYTNTKGKTVEAKRLLDVRCNCRYKCIKNFTHEQRDAIFQNYWNIGSYERQKDFLCSNVKENTPERVRSSAKKRRVCSRSFYLDNKRVCKDFFLRTLNIGNRVLETALKSSSTGIFVAFDKRGKHAPHNKTPEAVINYVRQHIESFPTVEAHYTRQDTRRKFLGSDLNITQMYRLYKEKCVAEKKKAVSASKYRQVFCEEYNYSFHVPKKDQCQTCVIYHQKETSGDLTEDIKQCYEEHIKRKSKARTEKEIDKAKAKEDQSYFVATFDLEAVLPVPCSLVSQVYYKRKLSCYNLSFYSLKDASVTCYLWNETEGNRGSCEIGTCIQTYIQSLPLTIKHLCLYSDCCSGQNRNRFIASALLQAISKRPSLEKIDQKFLETGHTQMESDSVHAAVENAKRRTSVFVPSEWDTIVRLARKKKPYTVVPMKHYDFHDLKSLAKSVFPQNIVDLEGRKIHWMKVKWIQFRKAELSNIYVKYDFDEEFHCIKIKQSRKSISISSKLPRLYAEKLPIATAKKKDLISLCKSGTIPSEYHNYYENIPDDSTLRDCLPDPDALESDRDSDLE